MSKKRTSTSMELPTALVTRLPLLRRFLFPTTPIRRSCWHTRRRTNPPTSIAAHPTLYDMGARLEAQRESYHKIVLSPPIPRLYVLVQPLGYKVADR